MTLPWPRFRCTSLPTAPSRSARMCPWSSLETATDLMIGENAQHMEGVGVPPMRELLSKLREHQVPVYV
jgi:hypothetical protein